MQFEIVHCNINVLNLEKSLAFYKDALSLVEVKRKETDTFTLVYLGDGVSNFTIELTHLKERTLPYELGDNESHIAFRVGDIKAAHALHSEMGVIVYDNTAMGIYFIEDPDGYWLEIVS